MIARSSRHPSPLDSEQKLAQIDPWLPEV